VVSETLENKLALLGDEEIRHQVVDSLRIPAVVFFWRGEWTRASYLGRELLEQLDGVPTGFPVPQSSS
jgi:hypothetical protein